MKRDLQNQCVKLRKEQVIPMQDYASLPSSGCWRVVSYDVGKSAEESEALSAMASSFELS